MNRLKNLIREIHRRSLWQVLGIYVVASWAVLQVVDTLGGVLNLPDWFPSFAFALLLVGLPIVMATAFVQEGGPMRDEDEEVEPASATVVADQGAPSRIFNWKNAIVGGIGAFALWGVLAAGWILFGDAGLAATSGEDGTSGSLSSVEQSVAVLPFENLSGNPDNEYFSDGITEELLNALAQIPEMRVPGRTSSFAFKGQNITIQQIADTLDVAHVLEGSVRRSGDRVLITAQLVDARTDTHLWSNTFERQLDDVFAIQREIARAIVEQLQVTLSPEEETRLVLRGTDIPEAHEAYLRGRSLWNQRTEESLRNAVTEFERATELDAEYAEAWSGLADSYLLIDIWTDSLERRDFSRNLPLGLAAAQRSVSLRPDLGMGHTSLGYAHWTLGEWEEAESQYQRALDLNPGYATAYHWYGLFLVTTGRADEGVSFLERAVELDPVSRINSDQLATAVEVAGRMEEAIEQTHATIRLAPGWYRGWYILGIRLLDVGRYGEGREAWRRAGELQGQNPGEWEAIYDAMVRYRETGEVGTSPQLDGTWGIYARLGQLERAMDQVGDLVRAGTPGYAVMAHAFYTTEEIRAHPRYQALLEEAGITW